MRTLLFILGWTLIVGAQEKVPLPEGALQRFGSPAFRTHENIYTTALSDDGKLVAAGTVRKDSWAWIDVFDTSTGQRRWHIASSGAVRDVAFTPDGKHLVAAHEGSVVVLYDLATGKPVWQRKDAGSVSVCCFPDGQTIATQLGMTLVLLDRKTGEVRRQIDHQHHARITALAVSDQGDRLVSASEDGGVCVWDTTTWKVTHRIAAPRYVYGLALSPDGQRLAVAVHLLAALVWDLPTNKERWRVEAPKDRDTTGSLSFSADGQTLYTLYGRGHYFAADTGKLLGERQSLPYERARVDRRRQLVAPVQADQYVRLVDLATGKQQNPEVMHEFAPRGIAFVGSQVVTSGWDGLVVWDNAERPTRLHKEAVLSLLCSPDSSKLVCDLPNREEIGIWDVAQKKYLHRLAARQLLVQSAPYPPRVLQSTPNHVFASIRGQQIGLGRYDYNAEAPPTFVRHAPRSGLGSIYSEPGKFFAIVPGGRYALMADQSTEDEPRLVRWDFETNKADHTWKLASLSETMVAEYLSSDVPKDRPTMQSPAGPRVFLPNGSAYVAESEAGLLLLLAEDHTRVRLLCPRVDLTHTCSLDSAGFVTHRAPLALSADGRLLAVAGLTGIHLIETATGVRRRSFTPQEGVYTLTFAPDGLRLASTDKSCTPFVWDIYAAPTSAIPTLAECTTLLESTTPADVQRVLHHLRRQPARVLELAAQLPLQRPGDAAQVQRGLRDIDADRYAVREAAQKTLSALNGDWLTEMHAYRQKVKLSTDALERMEKVCAALRVAPLDAVQRRGARVLELLERLNTPEARREVERLASGAADCWQTQHAKETLARMKK